MIAWLVTFLVTTPIASTLAWWEWDTHDSGPAKLLVLLIIGLFWLAFEAGSILEGYS